MMEVVLTQHPVGQGGMTSGLLEIPGGRFHWVYDCGSNHTEALNREIAIVAARREVDCLFLSHLDSDHVNGVDRLLMAAPVKEVVLPYLNDLDRLIAAAHDDAAGSLAGTFLTFLGDIEGWFGARGVERVTYILPRDDDSGEEGEGPDLPRFGGDGEGAIEAIWRTSMEASDLPLGQVGTTDEGAIVRLLDPAASLHLQATGRAIDWLLAPYAHRPSDARLHAFTEAMSSKFGPNYLSDSTMLLSDRGCRAEIRESYDLIWSNHNLVSMALYAGPSNSSSWQGDRLHPPGWWLNASGQAIGWLGTGDMHLNSSRRRQAMMQHYRELLDQVNVFTLPHHGSQHNFHASLPTMMPNLTQCVAAAGPNGYGHPSTAVRQAVQSLGHEFLHVSDKGRSVLQWRHHR